MSCEYSVHADTPDDRSDILFSQVCGLEVEAQQCRLMRGSAVTLPSYSSAQQVAGGAMPRSEAKLG
jgi:hypothetical protein